VLRRPVESSQYLALRYTDRLDAAAGAVRSVVSKGDSFDNAAAEPVIGLYKTELIRRRDCRAVSTTFSSLMLEYVDWFNHCRLHGHCGDVPPVELEDAHYRSIPALSPEVPAEPASNAPGAVQGTAARPGPDSGRSAPVVGDAGVRAVEPGAVVPLHRHPLQPGEPAIEQHAARGHRRGAHRAREGPDAAAGASPCRTP
jgi:hypothetical protein